MRVSRLILCVFSTVVATLSPAIAFAAEDGINIPRIEGEPTFEDFAGMRPNSTLAQSMTKVENFIQREPYDGRPASQRTEVYIGYDQRRLYAIFLAFDAEPNLIRANMSPRENIGGDDSVEMTFDAFNDQRAALTFRATPLGVQWDARWTEGSSRRAGFDTTFEAVWDSEGELTDQGYMVKMAIPLRSLRFPDTLEQLWRVQFARQIPRLSEEAFWPAYSIAIEGRLNQTALLSGIRDVSPGNNSQFIPFVFARQLDALEPGAVGGPRFDKNSEQDVGLDAKLVFNDSFVLDVTVNPDFSQVESDEPQVTVNERFEVQYPERRPFFVENADFFETDSTLVFTRRIVDPEGGLRFTGRSGNYGFGAIMINDEAPGLNRPEGHVLDGEKANIAIMRGYRDINERDRIGFLLTDRELGDGYNRVASLDALIRLNESWLTQLQVIGTDSEPFTGGESKTGYQRNILLNRVGRTLNTHTHFIETSKDYRAELGFQNQYFARDTSGIHNRVNLNFYPEDSSLTTWGTALMVVYLTDQKDVRTYAQVDPSVNFRFATSNVGLSWSDRTEILRPQDFAGIITNQVYDSDTWRANYSNTTLQTLTFSAGYQAGTTINRVPLRGFLPGIADTSRIDLDVLWRPLDRLRVSNTYLYTELESQNGSAKIFSNEIIRSNWNYQFTPELSLRFIAQYEETDAGTATRLVDDKNLNFDLLMRYVINPWSAFYVGYNSNQSNFDIIEIEGERELVVADDLRQDGDQFFVKFSYLFQR